MHIMLTRSNHEKHTTMTLLLSNSNLKKKDRWYKMQLSCQEETEPLKCLFHV